MILSAHSFFDIYPKTAIYGKTLGEFMKKPSLSMLLLSVLCLMLLPLPALAAAPQYDIKASCAEVAAAAGGSSMIELQCRKDEEAAKGRVDKMQVPDKTLRFCNEVTSTMGAGSYIILEQCIKDELKAAQQLQ